MNASSRLLGEAENAVRALEELGVLLVYDRRQIASVVEQEIRSLATLELPGSGSLGADDLR